MAISRCPAQTSPKCTREQNRRSNHRREKGRNEKSGWEKKSRSSAVPLPGGMERTSRRLCQHDGDHPRIIVRPASRCRQFRIRDISLARGQKEVEGGPFRVPWRRSGAESDAGTFSPLALQPAGPFQRFLSSLPLDDQRASVGIHRRSATATYEYHTLNYVAD